MGRPVEKEGKARLLTRQLAKELADKLGEGALVGSHTTNGQQYYVVHYGNQTLSRVGQQVP